MATLGAASARPGSSLMRRPAFWIYLIVVIAGLAFMISRLALISADPPVSLAVWIGLVIQAGALLLWGWLILPRRRATPWTAIIAAALAYVILRDGRRWGLVLAAFAFAILLHLTPNTVGVLVGGHPWPQVAREGTMRT